MTTSHHFGMQRGPCFGLGVILLLVVSSARPQQPNSQNATPQHRDSGAGASIPNASIPNASVPKKIAPKKKEEKTGEQKAESNGAQQAPESSNIDASQVDASLYTGTETCKGCHEDEGNKFGANPHSKTLTNKRPDRQGCESCHGPGQSHSEAGDPENIVRFESLSKAETSKICSECHDLSKGAGWAVHEQHSKASVGCLECHTIHTAKVQQRLLKSERPKLCSTCHASKQ